MESRRLDKNVIKEREKNQKIEGKNQYEESKKNYGTTQAKFHRKGYNNNDKEGMGKKH